MHTRSSRALLERLALAERILRETPVIPLRGDQIRLFAKLEFLNGIGSIKDRPAFWILKQAIERGEVGPSTTIVESSSGNFACALATFCKVLGLDFVPVIDPNISPVYRSQLRSLCSREECVEEPDDTGGFLKTRLARVQSLLKDIPGSYCPNQYGNPDAMAAHYCMTGAEIVRALPVLDYLFVGVGSAGTIAGLSQRVREHYPSVRIIAVDAEGSVIFGQTPQKRWIPGIGSSIKPPLLEKTVVDDVVIVPESDTIAGCHELMRTHGLFVGGSSGSAYSAVRQYFTGHRGRIPPVVLFLCCDRGVAYLHNIFDRQWARWRTSLSPAMTNVAHG